MTSTSPWARNLVLILWTLGLVGGTKSSAFIPRTTFTATSTLHRQQLGLPRDGLTTNQIAIGWYPSDGNAAEGVESPRYTLREINSRLGAKSSTYGVYSHLDSDNYTGYELFEVFDDSVGSGAVFIPAVMPVLDQGFSGVTPQVAAQVATVMRALTDRGVQV